MNAPSWDGYPSRASQDFFRKSMEGHTRVSTVSQRSPNRWDLRLDSGRVLVIFLTDVYTFSSADYAALRTAHSNVDVIVSASHWNHFSTAAAEEAGRDQVLTVMLGGELMSILHELNRSR